MPAIRIGAITPGLTLSSDVKDLNGRLLLRQGVCLQERHLQLLKSWGVTEVEVVEVPADKNSSAQFSAAEREQHAARLSAEESLRLIFSRNDSNHPMIRELFELCAARKAKLPW